MTERTELGPREALFLRHYLGGPDAVRFNGVEAILACGYTTDRRSASVLAVKELDKPAVREAVRRFVRQQVSTAEKALARTATLAYADIDEVLSWDADGQVTVKPTAEMSRAGKALLGGIVQHRTVVTHPDGTVVERVRLEVKLRDVDGARRDLLRFHGLLRNKVEVTGADGQPLTLRVALDGPAIELPRNGREVEPPRPPRRIGPAQNGGQEAT